MARTPILNFDIQVCCSIVSSTTHHLAGDLQAHQYGRACTPFCQTVTQTSLFPDSKPLRFTHHSEVENQATTELSEEGQVLMTLRLEWWRYLACFVLLQIFCHFFQRRTNTKALRVVDDAHTMVCGCSVPRLGLRIEMAGVENVVENHFLYGVIWSTG